MNKYSLSFLATLFLLPMSVMAATTPPTEATQTTPTTPMAEPNAEKNLMEANAYLEKNKQKSGVKTTASGLQYEVIKTGSGTPPGPTDLATVHYKGTLTNGTPFDSSYERGTPNTFPVNAVIPGWTEALQLMTPGSKWILTIPPKLAYGARGAGPKIGPNATLIFEVELISVQPSDTTLSSTLEDTDEDG
jgi:FKBP-type peptidyl-prolyl cis-trans isomerase